MQSGQLAHHSFIAWNLFLLLMISACKNEVVPEEYLPSNAHERYKHAIHKLGLSEYHLGKLWVEQSSLALSQPTNIDLPYLESFHVDQNQVLARGYRFHAKRGEKIGIQIERLDSNQLILFGDLFRIDNDSLQQYRHIASLDSIQKQLIIEINDDAEYNFRLQPELLSEGNFTCRIKVGPTLDFPVLGGDRRDIGSFFGDPRDGGRRKHHGVDIFAKRHTPIVSPVAGNVRFAGEKGLGGRVVWLRDSERGQTLYFAHLQDIYVRDNQRIEIGDTLGTVGNTGNARTTPPHLHFGIYKNGPIDPYYFVASKRKRVKKIKGDASLLGTTVRTNQSIEIENITLPRYQLVSVAALASDSFLAMLPSGTSLWLPIRQIETIDDPIRIARMDERIALAPAPKADQIAMTYVNANEPLTYHGRSEDFWLVKKTDGQQGWLENTP